MKMNESTKKQLTRRIKSANGHLKGIEGMITEDAYCIDIIRQVQAVQAALDKINSMILENHLQTCVTAAIQGDDPTERKQMLSEITAVFDTTQKL